MDSTVDFKGSPTASRSESQGPNPADASVQIDEFSHPNQTSEPVNSVLQEDSLHSEETPETLDGQVQDTLSLSFDTAPVRLFIKKSMKQFEGEFVDLQLFDEWTEGYATKSTEEFVIVIVNHPSLSGENKQYLPRESISEFRTKTRRSSLTSHLETCLQKSASLDFESLIRADLLSKSYSLTQERFLQFFTGVLPLGCSLLKHMNQETRKELFKSLICPSLIAFFRDVVYHNSELINRALSSVLDAELMLLSEGLFEPIELIVSHLETIVSTYCPVCVVKTFKDLMQYCAPIQRQNSLNQMILQRNHLKTYVEAGLVYIDYCIRCVNWSDAQSVLTQVLIANAQCHDPILDVQMLNKIIENLMIIQHCALWQLKADILTLILSTIDPGGSHSIRDLLEFSLIDSTNIHYFLATAPSSASLKFLDCCSRTSELNIYRSLISSAPETLEEVVMKASTDDLAPPCNVIREYYLQCSTSTDVNTDIENFK